MPVVQSVEAEIQSGDLVTTRVQATLFGPDPVGHASIRLNTARSTTARALTKTLLRYGPQVIGE